MIIRHINSFFHRNSRWLFGIFTVIIAFAFTDFMTRGGGSGCAFTGDPKVGTVFGRKVTIGDMNDMYRRQEILAFSLYGYVPRMSPSDENLFMLIAQLEGAKRRGIVASDAQIADFIRSVPRFSKDGVFDVALFNSFVSEAAERGFSRAEIDAAIGDFIVVNALSREISDSVIVTDAELAAFYRVMNEKFNVRRAEFKAADFKSTPPDDAAVAAFFERNKTNYRMPARAKAVIALFSYSDPVFVKAAEAAATPEALQRFYESNSTLFLKTEKDKSTVLPPFKDVEASVREKFLAATAEKLAMEAARNFSRSVYNDSEEDITAAFKAAAAKNNIKTAATGVISAGDEKIGEMTAPELVKAIFKNIDTVPVTDAVAAERAACVAVAFDIQHERQAELEEVSEKVKSDCAAAGALENARAAAALRRAKLAPLTPEELKKAVLADKDFAAVPSFTRMTRPNDALGAWTAGVAEVTPGGEVSQAVDLPDGALLVYVESRTAADVPTEFDALFRDSYRAFKGEGARRQYLRHLNGNCSFRNEK